MSNEWEVQLKHIQNTVDSISTEVKENRKELQALKQEMSTGKGAIKAIAWIGLVLTIIWTTVRLLTYK